ncbi:MAG: hypothetical protein ACR2PO_17865 [Methyloligellaceae bacterium]
MNTPTHILVSAALFARPDDARRNVAALAGALLPDLSIYVMYGLAKAGGVPEYEIWGTLHFTPFWQDWAAAANSVPIYAVLMVLALARNWAAAQVFCLSALAHIALDLPFHNDDAHRHFWPISDWRFRSPVSYWNPDHHGLWVSMVEVGLALLLVIVLWRRFRSFWVRVPLILALPAYVIVPLHFMSVLG